MLRDLFNDYGRREPKEAIASELPCWNKSWPKQPPLLSQFVRIFDARLIMIYAKPMYAAIQLVNTNATLSFADPVLQSAFAEYREVSAEQAIALDQVAQAFLISRKPADTERLLNDVPAMGEKATGGKNNARAQRLCRELIDATAALLAKERSDHDRGLNDLAQLFTGGDREPESKSLSHEGCDVDQSTPK